MKNPNFDADMAVREFEFIASVQVLASTRSNVADTNVTIWLQRLGFAGSAPRTIAVICSVGIENHGIHWV